jgi:hypothetical protein
MSAYIHFTLYLFILYIWKFKTGSLNRPEDINIVIEFFVPPNEELEIAPPKIWMYPQK